MPSEYISIERLAYVNGDSFEKNIEDIKSGAIEGYERVEGWVVAREEVVKALKLNVVVRLKMQINQSKGHLSTRECLDEKLQENITWLDHRVRYALDIKDDSAGDITLPIYRGAVSCLPEIKYEEQEENKRVQAKRLLTLTLTVVYGLIVLTYELRYEEPRMQPRIETYELDNGEGIIVYKESNDTDSSCLESLPQPAYNLCMMSSGEKNAALSY